MVWRAGYPTASYIQAPNSRQTPISYQAAIRSPDGKSTGTTRLSARVLNATCLYTHLGDVGILPAISPS